MEKLNLITYNKTDDVLKDSKQIIDAAQKKAYHAVNILLVERNWLLGKRISEEFMSGNGQDRYGKQIISELSEILDKQTSANIFHCFYQAEDLLSCVPKILCCCILIHRFLQCADSTKNWEIRVYSM